jgi:hypothetical protein
MASALRAAADGATHVVHDGVGRPGQFPMRARRAGRLCAEQAVADVRARRAPSAAAPRPRRDRRIAGEAEAQAGLAARAESGARRQADIGLVDQIDAELARIGAAVDREELVEGPDRRRERNAVRRLQTFGDDPAAFGCARDLLGDEGSPSSSAAIAARWTKTGEPEVEYWIRFSMIWPKAGAPRSSRCASRSSPSSSRRSGRRGRGPPRSMTSWKEAARASRHRRSGHRSRRR